MAAKRLREIIAIILIGDGVVGLLDPKRHVGLWRRGPEPYREAMVAFSKRPWITRTLSAAEAITGIMIAHRQEPD